jgi:hypothetical protein
MPTVYCYPVKLTIADLIRAKSICSQTQFSHIINRLLTSLVRSVLWNIRPLFFAWTSLLRRSVHTKKPRSDISQYCRPYARSINNYYYMAFQNSLFWLVDKRSVKTHIRTVVRIFRILTGVPDVVYLAGNFCFANRKNFCFLIFQLCVIKIYR